MTTSRLIIDDEDALLFHSQGSPGKISIAPTKPLTTQRDLSLAYSPGVAVPCLRIADDPSLAYEYTAKGNLVAVISNGTAVLGLGNLGALASKPVMEGKAVLFKRFADIDAIDLEVDTTDVDAFVDSVRYLGKSFSGINLEDIRAPECFIIEQRLRELMDIPVFHDDQHGTAIIVCAALLNALDLTGRDIAETRVVVNGAGAAGIACLELAKSIGIRNENALLCDRKGVIHKDRDGLNQWKSAHAAETDLRTLEQAMKGADVFLGVSAKGAVTAEMVAGMADQPIIFAMANPDPEIAPEEVAAVRDDAIMATGRSDYPNQVNNVLGFPYIFRGAIDARATTFNEEMKIAAARALAALAREEVPEEAAAAYGGVQLHYGPEYIIPVPFDPRLISHVPPAVAQAAMDSGVARRPITDMETYKHELRSRLDPIAGTLELVFKEVRANPRRMVFAEGEDEKTIRAALAYHDNGFGTAVLIGREQNVHETIAETGLKGTEALEVHNASLSASNERYIDFLYRRLQREGALYRDCQRLVNNDRNVFAACMVALGDADALVTGLTRNYWAAYDDVRRVLDPEPGKVVFGLSLIIARGSVIVVADTAVHELPSAEELAAITIQGAGLIRRLGQEPRAALLSFSNFGNPTRARTERIREAVALLAAQKVDFEYDGEMSADVALDPELMALYPFSRLSKPANVLIMPSLHAANISSKLLQALGGGTVIGPMLTGLEHPAQIVLMGTSVSNIINMAAFAAHDAKAGAGRGAKRATKPRKAARSR